MMGCGSPLRSGGAVKCAFVVSLLVCISTAYVAGLDHNPAENANDTVNTLIRGVAHREDLVESLSGSGVMYCTYSTEQLKAEAQYRRKHDLKPRAMSLRGAQVVVFHIRDNKWRIEVVDLEISGFNEWGILKDEPITGGGEHQCAFVDPHMLYCSDGEKLYWWWPHINQGKVEAFRPAAQRVGPVWRLRAWLTLGLGGQRYSSESLQELGTFEFVGSESISGYDCYRISRHHIGSIGPFRCSVCVAPEAGFAIVEWEELLAFSGGDGPRGLRQVWRVRNLEKVAPGLWLPSQTVYFMYMYSPQSGWEWRKTLEMHFDDLQVNQHGDHDAFALQFPIGAGVEYDEGGRTRWRRVGDPVIARQRHQDYAPPPHDVYSDTATIEDEFPDNLWNSWMEGQGVGNTR